MDLIWKYLNLARELRKLWNMKVTVVPTVTGALGVIPRGLEEMEIEGWTKTTQTTD